MERNDNLPQQLASSSLTQRVAAGGSNLTSSSSSSYSSSASPPDLMRQLNAALRHRRPLGSRAARAARVLDPQRRPLVPPLIESNAGRAVGQAIVSAGATGVRNEGSEEMGKNPSNDSSLTPPSVNSTITDVHEENMKSDHLGPQNGDSEMLGGGEKATLALAAFQNSLEYNVVPENDELNKVKKVQASPAFSTKLTSQKAEGISGNQITMYEQDYRQQGVQNMGMSSSGMPFAGNLEGQKEQSHIQNRFPPEIRSTVVSSSHVATIAVHSGPIFQSAHAPSVGQGEFPTQIVSSASENQIGIRDHAHPNEQGILATEGSLMLEKLDLNSKEDKRSREIADNACHLQSQASSTSNSSAKADMKPPQTGRAEKANRRKKYDSDVFFKVNGKLYQKLGKIGSGGSSEVHKVISSDCTIYALKKIKLKGRDYETAYGFCQEIGYLNKLKGKNNIIQLMDYEVTDKTLLQQAMEESKTSRDGKIKDDQYIYMVLEYGEIDLAHMLLQKWQNMDSSSWKMDENWLRYYWQQMLEAVNTIHEERIVHSDLKPANFLLVRGSLKLIDFGIAKAIMSDTTNIQREAQVGTLNYMSPEAFMWNEQDPTGGTIKCGRPSDIWSLGCILYQMVYGKPPFADYKTFWAKFKVITDENHEITYEPTVNPLLIDLMKRCLAWDRSNRSRIPQLLEHPFLVPPLPQHQPSPENHPCKMLFHRVQLHWSEPEVLRLCSELSCAISRLEKAGGRKY